MSSSSSSEPSGIKNEAPTEKDFRTPGFRGAKTTTLFRAINPELFIKPNKPVMAFGLFSITMCVAILLIYMQQRKIRERSTKQLTVKETDTQEEKHQSGIEILKSSLALSGQYMERLSSGTRISSYKRTICRTNFRRVIKTISGPT